jgi:ascorbate-specific PTS system EIIC-type component UlaA
MDDKLNQDQAQPSQESNVPTVSGRGNRIAAFIICAVIAYILLIVGYFVYLVISASGFGGRTMYTSDAFSYALLMMVFTFYDWILIPIPIALVIAFVIDWLKRKKQKGKEQKAKEQKAKEPGITQG